MNIDARIEGLLFVASRPMSLRKIADVVGSDTEAVQQSIDRLREHFNTEARGIQIARLGSSVQMVTNPLQSKIVSDFLKEERSGELTRPALETLTIIAYRGPVAKSEIDLIRGVNCSLILRNLMVRGLITSREDNEKMVTLYEISFDFLRHLGIRDVKELPDFDTLNSDQRLQQFLKPSHDAESQVLEGTDASDVSEERSAISE